MKIYVFTLLLVLLATISRAQILPGTLNVTGASNITQSINDLIQEAGVDDNESSFESNFDANIVSFILDPLLNPLTLDITDSEQACTLNIFRYSVYMHTLNAPQNLIIEAKTSLNSGVRYPFSIPYDNTVDPILGPRDLYTQNGGQYIPIPNDPSVAIKVFEFIGCRTDIPIQFRAKASSLAISGTGNFQVVYTILGSLF
ncbi:hypothetical protein [Algoriphagus pacificus]|uniref:Uncharacterized protein n=1 Tax=Algoriphagus pacificus TaxID=2811234 RepID=A0ABS3CKR1_9BACT|nr:hypothetical protein [Algoriphagus pacificus]MBN7817693.1 hypothetical protein [Algoriphagus pacificus]